MSFKNSERIFARTSCCNALIVATLLSCACGTARADDDGPTVTPYRPTISNPADLPVPGWLEGELGVLATHAEDRTRDDSVPWLLKFAFDEDHGVLVGGNAYVRSAAAGMPAQNGVGDTSIEWKQRFSVSANAAFGIEAGVVLPTAEHGLGIGKPESLVNGIFSADVGAWHVDLNLARAHFAAHPLGASAWQTAWAAAVSAPLGTDWGAAFELSGTYQRGIATQSQALFALNYNASHRVVLDAGVAYGLAHDAHDRSLFAGATLLLGKLRD
ncbi:MAG TPA: hypothetical protein VF132_09975 [Rudaea sp.]